jgi:amino acid adenylation domain-containing protein
MDQAKGQAVSEGLTVVDWVTTAATRNPDSFAIVDQDGAVTYADLIERSGLLAEELLARGVGRGDLVALRLPRSASFIVAALATQRAGAGYLPVDPAYPEGRIRTIISDSGAGVLVTTDDMVLPGEDDVDVLRLHGGGILPVGGTAPKCILTAPGPTDLAYAIYTSGSTGQPKGVMVEQTSLANLVQWHIDEFGIVAADRASQIASPGFDAAVWEIWPYLASGACIYIPGDEVRASAANLRAWLLEKEITVSFLPTPLAEDALLLDWPEVAPLRYMLTGGDVLRRWPPAGLPFTLVNNYGITEAAVVSTSGIVLPGDVVSDLPPVGRPIRNVDLYVVDDDLSLVADGECGELLIGGISVARGYLNRPELTAERFLPNPFSTDASARVYRTGDLVRRHPDGSISFAGRADDQVKIRGFRVELGEISAVLNRHPSVRSSVASVIPLGEDERALVAFLVASGDEEPTSLELRDYLGHHLPDYMLPVSFVWLEELPVTEHGKIDRAALAAIDGAELLQRAPVTAPRNEIESAAAGIVADLLGLSEVSVDENFFLIGGHSLLGAQLIVRLEDEFGVELTLRTLFDKPTIEELAVEIDHLVAQEALVQ